MLSLHSCTPDLPSAFRRLAPSLRSYRILTVPMSGELRFASAAAKRLASLGALLHGDRNAVDAGQSLKECDIDNAHGEWALNHILEKIAGNTPNEQLVPPVKVRLVC